MAVKKNNEVLSSNASARVVFHQGMHIDTIDLLGIRDVVSAFSGTLFQKASKLVAGWLVTGFSTEGVVKPDDSAINRSAVYVFKFSVEFTPYSRKAIETAATLCAPSLANPTPDGME